jgi:lactoylglutathione lyase
MNALAKTAPNVTQAVPMFHVRDMPASLHFYLDGVGFSKANEWVVDGRIRWCSLELGGAAVMLQAWMTEGPHRNVPDTPAGLGVSVNFMCRDALEMYRELKARGVDAKRPFVGNAMWVTSVTDPDGYQLHFESPTDVPEETVFEG